MIYVIKTDSEPSFIKIGFTFSNPIGRMNSLQTGCPHKLLLIYSKKGTEVHEKLLHGRLSEFRTHGEWFRFTRECHLLLIELFKELRLINHSGEARKRNRPRDIKYLRKTEQIMNLLNSGTTTYEAAKILGINRHTVMRHSKEWRERNPSFTVRPN